MFALTTDYLLCTRVMRPDLGLWPMSLIHFNWI